LHPALKTPGCFQLSSGTHSLSLTRCTCSDYSFALSIYFRIVKKTWCTLLALLLVTTLAPAEETSFKRVKVPDLKGHQAKAVLTFSDDDRAVEVRPVKGDVVNIPYARIDRFSYEFTKKHRIKQGAIVMLASIPGGAIVMMTKSRSHWLEIDYRDQDMPQAYVVRMDKRDYLHILDAVKTHTGKEAEILGNADKRKK
jgi:hypothetical protein